MKRQLFIPLAALLFALVLIHAADTHANEETEIPEYITIRGERYSTSLTELDLSGFAADDLTNTETNSLRYMTSLTELNLMDNGITDLTPLSNLTNLEYLGLFNNQIRDLTPLANLTSLVTLSIEGNPITNWSPIDHVEQVWGRP